MKRKRQTSTRTSHRKGATTAARRSARKRTEPARKRSTKGSQPEHLRGVGSKEQREYEHILDSARKSGRYGGRAKEVAARTVMKQHKQHGHRKGT